MVKWTMENLMLMYVVLCLNYSFKLNYSLNYRHPSLWQWVQLKNCYDKKKKRFMELMRSCPDSWMSARSLGPLVHGDELDSDHEPSGYYELETIEFENRVTNGIKNNLLDCNFQSLIFHLKLGLKHFKSFAKN